MLGATRWDIRSFHISAWPYCCMMTSYPSQWYSLSCKSTYYHAIKGSCRHLVKVTRILPKQYFSPTNKHNTEGFLPEASFDLRVLSLPASVCLFVCLVCLSVCQSLACPRDDSGPVQARITKFGLKMQKTLVKVPIFLWTDRPWPSRSNLTWKSRLGLLNLYQRCKLPWLRSLLFWEAIDLDLQGQIWLKKCSI